MSQLLRSLLLLTVSLFLGGCGGGSMPAPTPVGIFVQSMPANQTAYAAMAPPQNQVSFAAAITYSDGSVGSTPISGVQWANSDSWGLAQPKRCYVYATRPGINSWDGFFHGHCNGTGERENLLGFVRVVLAFD